MEATMMLHTAPRDRQISLAIPVAIALGWVLALFIAPEVGLVAYAAPLVGPAACLALLGLYRSPARRPLTTILLLIMVIFVLSLNFRQRDLGETGLDWQNGMKFAVWCAIIGLGAVRWRELVEPMRRPLIGLSFIYAAIALLSATWSEVPAYTAASAVGLLAYLVLSCFVVRDLDEAATMRIMVWSLGAYLLAGLLAGALSFDVAWLAPSVDENVSRLQGLSGHPNTFGQQAAVFITLTAITWRMGIFSKRAAVALLIVGLGAILASGSRTNLAAALAAWCVIGIRGNPWRRIILLAGMAMLATLLMVAATGGLPEIDTFVKGLSRTGAEGEIFTLTGRTELWATAWNLIAEKPLLGWGYNGIEDIMARSVSAGFEGTAINAHNMLLQSLASLGFAGSLPAAAAIGVLSFRSLTQPDSSRDQIALLLLVTGFGEVGIAATPILLTMVVFYFFARDGERSARAAIRHGIA
jgi:O-antigen ligase